MRRATFQGGNAYLYGRTKKLSPEDIDLFFEQVGMGIAETLDDSVTLIVRGRLMNPIEEEEADEAERNGMQSIEIAELEAAFAAQVDADSLLGSLKLFADQERIVNLLHNEALPDDLFCAILGLFDWQEKAPFEIDANRDISACIINRFYEDAKRNHNIAHASVGLALVAAQAENPKILSILARMPDMELSKRSMDVWTPRTLHEALLINPHLAAEDVVRFAKSDDLRLQGFAAAHGNLPLSWQEKLSQSRACWVHEGLSCNPALSPSLTGILLASDNPKVRASTLEHQPLPAETVLPLVTQLNATEAAALGRNLCLGQALYAELIAMGNIVLNAALAGNEKLSKACLKQLGAVQDRTVEKRLACNPNVDRETLEKFYKTVELHESLAANPSLPEPMARALFSEGRETVLRFLAANPATPLDLLQQLQIYPHLHEIVKRNPTFGRNIQRNIGWGT